MCNIEEKKIHRLLVPFKVTISCVQAQSLEVLFLLFLSLILISLKLNLIHLSRNKMLKTKIFTRNENNIIWFTVYSATFSYDSMDFTLWQNQCVSANKKKKHWWLIIFAIFLWNIYLLWEMKIEIELVLPSVWYNMKLINVI